MRPDFESLFSRLETVEPPPELEPDILRRVRREAYVAASRRRLLSGSIGLVTAGPLAFFAVRALDADLARSGAGTFLSLMFTDADLVMRYAGGFATTVLEALPAVSLVAVLATAVAVVLSAGTLIVGLRGFLAQDRSGHLSLA